ncbi:hypothetical protein GCM10025857_03030 [Alicyclobacillus contaminans]|nr:hypothetical protein GCM10025857_03030 [Alicyclobacillus contaminans]
MSSVDVDFSTATQDVALPTETAMKGFWYSEWAFPIFVACLAAGIFTGTHLYYVYHVGAFNDIAVVAMLAAGIKGEALAPLRLSVQVFYSPAFSKVLWSVSWTSVAPCRPALALVSRLCCLGPGSRHR